MPPGRPGANPPALIPQSNFDAFASLLAVAADPEAAKTRVADLHNAQVAYVQAREDSQEAEAIARATIKDAGQRAEDADKAVGRAREEVANEERHRDAVKAETEDALRQLADQRKAFQDEAAAEHAALDEKRQAIHRAQQKLDADAEANAKRSNELEDRERNVAAREAEAKRVVDDYNSRLARMQEAVR